MSISGSLNTEARHAALSAPHRAGRHPLDSHRLSVVTKPKRDPDVPPEKISDNGPLSHNC
eukprot:24528-Eustigmatos_ZCMA.PRE.1